MSQSTEAVTTSSAADDQITAAGGGYELLHRRLETQAATLAKKTTALNEARIVEFGRSDLKLLSRLVARTENNCVARDIVRLGDQLLFAYNVFIGLRKETTVQDVFGLYQLLESETGFELQPQPIAGSFLADSRFAADFRELYAYYKQASLIQLRVRQQKLLAAFQIGQQLTDVRVFRWAIGNDGALTYIDNRGERDIALPPSYDFEWTTTTREQHVLGRHPHINILDTVFVETINGDLTIKIENNTESGLGIFSETVDDKNQSLADADIAYAKLGALVLLRIKPYREEITRYFVFNGRTQQVHRIDAIGKSCVQLPEDHGIIFPGGYLLQSGEYKQFDLPAADVEGLRFKRMLKSPNGEDVLYVFYEASRGGYGLFPYNLIEKKLATPLMVGSYTGFADGRFLVFQREHEEPVRSHPMQLWQTPFTDEEFTRSQTGARTFYGRVGNPELVRGVSELFDVCRAVREQTATRVAYEDMIRQCGRILDAYFWLSEAEAGDLASDVRAINETARLTLDEFDKVTAIRREAGRLLGQAQAEAQSLLTDIAGTLWQHPDAFVSALAKLQAQRGHLSSLKEKRYIDLAQIEKTDTLLAAEEVRVGERAVVFLAADKSFAPYRKSLSGVSANISLAGNSATLDKLIGELDDTAKGLDLLTGLMGGLTGGDANVRSRILDEISSIYGDVNRIRAEARQRRKALGSQESAAEFGAQLRLFGQSVENALELATTPEKCDEALTRLLARIEELEGSFGEQETFLSDIASKREQVYEALSARRQALVDARIRRGHTLAEAGVRILQGVPRRIAQLTRVEDVHSYFAADPLLAKLRTLISDLRAIDAVVAADDLDTQLKTARDQAIRSVRDRQELVASDGNAIRLGRHAFSINRQALELTLLPRAEELFFHLTGTDYYAPVNAPELAKLKTYWDQQLVSESVLLYRAEYLAGQMLAAANTEQHGLSLSQLQTLAISTDGSEALLERVREFAAPRYAEGYQKGVHDHDAARILTALVHMETEAGLLAFGPRARALACAYWAIALRDEEQQALQRHARSCGQLQRLFGVANVIDQAETELTQQLLRFGPRVGFFSTDSADSETLANEAARYLLRELADIERKFIVSAAGQDLADAFVRHLQQAGHAVEWQQQVDACGAEERWQMVRRWVARFVAAQNHVATAWVDDAAAVLAFALQRYRRNATLEQRVEGLLGESTRIQAGVLLLNLNDFHARYCLHVQVQVPGFTALQQLKLQVLTEQKERMRLNQFQAKPLSSFVRNRLIDEVYLPMVGDNLAKQIGTVGDSNRSDRMGMLLLISPPGYGKTTLMEYIADRLGLIFVRINCPALGHEVTSLDPSKAPHSGAKSELEKLNLSLAMGNNVMLYLDDIQHTNPEFLQKFIALSDGTRRIEGVWDGEPRTFDLRGKRFAIVMAGNPYTESGDVFKIPDMLTNRADIYNLGDVLSGRDELFALSYLENSLTANPVTLPLATRDPKDVRLLARMASGEDIATNEFSYAYSAAELNELVALFKHLFVVRDLLLKVNLAYIASAAQDDRYRTEPPFKLQGSYRNMTKLAAKMTAAMQPAEIDSLLRDHYRGEAQTLTVGAEENLLKLAQLLGTSTVEEAARWQAIVAQFQRDKLSGGADADGATRVSRVLANIAGTLGELQDSATLMTSQRQSVDKTPPLNVQLTAPDAMTEAVHQLAQLFEKGLLPLVAATHHKMKLDHGIWEKLREMNRELKRLGILEESDNGDESVDSVNGPAASTKGQAGKTKGVKK